MNYYGRHSTPDCYYCGEPLIANEDEGGFDTCICYDAQFDLAVEELTLAVGDLNRARRGIGHRSVGTAHRRFRRCAAALAEVVTSYIEMVEAEAEAA